MTREDVKRRRLLVIKWQIAEVVRKLKERGYQDIEKDYTNRNK